MTETPYKERYVTQLDSLSIIMEESNRRIMQEIPDSLFVGNVNFFTKSFLVIMCVYLESYIKDVLEFYGNELDKRLSSCFIPHNLVKWSLQPLNSLKPADQVDCVYKINITKENIDKHISANPYRTKGLFTDLGIYLDKCTPFFEKVDEINSIVTKRNQIVHYNDDASDVSDGDLKHYIVTIKEYISILDAEICRCIYTE